MLSIFNNYIKSFLNQFFLFNLFFVFIFVFALISYIRLDAEWMIFVSVLLVFFSIWNLLADFLSNLLNVKGIQYYFYFVRFYQGRLWLIFLLNGYFSLSLYINKITKIFNCYNLYKEKFQSYIDLNSFSLIEKWNLLLNFYTFNYISLLMSQVWIFFYKSVIDIYIFQTNNSVIYSLNSKKLAEYILLNITLIESFED
jgi:hypothetical protein